MKLVINENHEKLKYSTDNFIFFNQGRTQILLIEMSSEWSDVDPSELAENWRDLAEENDSVLESISVGEQAREFLGGGGDPKERVTVLNHQQ